uniref:Fibronectin type-III domain-containing protein n=1 Tax=Knipowitschia caucasica TaxID=637954 RepID=A0AAV2KFB1_KNICA
MLMVRAVTAVGVSPSAEVSIKTAPCSPPRDPEATAESTQLFLHWKKPAEMGPNVTVLKYMVNYGRTEKKVRWEQVESGGETVTISNLQPQTSYTIRVLCECGPHGNSKKSQSYCQHQSAKKPKGRHQTIL